MRGKLDLEDFLDNGVMNKTTIEEYVEYSRTLKEIPEWEESLISIYNLNESEDSFRFRYIQCEYLKRVLFIREKEMKFSKFIEYTNLDEIRGVINKFYKDFPIKKIYYNHNSYDDISREDGNVKICRCYDMDGRFLHIVAHYYKNGKGWV